MTTLRVLLSTAPDDARSDCWARFDPSNRVIDSGIDRPSRWPEADRREAVLRADAVRVIALDLPPLPPSRVPSAAAYALEDQLAGPAETQVIAIDTERSHRPLVARVTSRALIDALAARFDRVIAEPDLVPIASAWQWCADEFGGFVRRSDGSAFPIGPLAADAELPAELAVALAQAGRAGALPAEVVVNLAIDGDDRCAPWQSATGITFRKGARWQWQNASALFEAAPDFFAVVKGAQSRPQPRGIARLFVPAALLVALAIALHVAATVGSWAAARFQLARSDRALAELARQIGAGAATPDTASSLILRSYAIKRHEAGLSAPSDALPLLARVAPALASIPAGTVKSASYSGLVWTLDLAPLDDTVVADLERRIEASGIPAVHARVASGARMRIGPAP